MSYDPYKQPPPNMQPVMAQAVPMQQGMGYGYNQPQQGYGYNQPQQGMGYNPGMMMQAPQQQQHFGYQGAQAVMPMAPGGSAQSTNPQQMAAQQGDISFLSNHKRLILRQRFELLESLANMVGLDVIEFSNKYDFFDADTGQPLLFAAEESNCLCRACCKPHHEAKLHVFDVRSGQTVPLFTIDKPFKFSCCIIADICTQSQRANTMTGNPLGRSHQSFPCGGYCQPTMEVKDANDTHEFTVKGPMCMVGGCIELCMDQEFEILNKSTNEKVGRILHMKPENMTEGAKQVAGDSDNYLMELPQGLTAEKTANFVGTMLLLDYMFFEGGPPCGLEGGAIKINLCNLFCCGCIYPCHLTLGGEPQGGDGGGGGF